MSPATGLAGAATTFVTDRSADAPTTVANDDALLPVAGSNVAVVTTALFVFDPSVTATTRTVSVRVPLTATVPSDGQLTTSFPPTVAVSPPFVALRYLTPPGSVSDSVTASAGDGPAFTVTST